MRTDAFDTITDFVQRRKGGRRCNVRSSYLSFNSTNETSSAIAE